MLFESQIISRGSGSIGGLTASHNKGGNYFRARVTPVDPGTPFQVFVRTILAALVNLWQNSLTQVQRDAWDVYATNVQLLNPFGAARTVTGLNMFTRVNVPRIQAGASTVLDAPTIFNTGEFTVTNTTFQAAAGIFIFFTQADTWANETGSIMLLYVSRPQNPGIKFFKGPYRFVGSVVGDAGGLPEDNKNFPTPPFPFVQGQRVFSKVSVARIDGRLSTIQRGTNLVTA